MRQRSMTRADMPDPPSTTQRHKEGHVPTTDEAVQMRGMTAVANDGDKLGKIEDIYLDQETGKPEWMALKTGLFAGHLSFVPLADARRDGDTIAVPYDKATVKDAPRVDADAELSQPEEAHLYRHYGLDYSQARSDSGLPEGAAAGHVAHDQSDRSGDPTPHGTPGVVGNDVSGPETDHAMTRSEEELRVGTTRRETGRARLRKYVVTENVTETVPVQHEEVRIEREPVTEANSDEATDGPAISEEEHEVVLHAEQPVVEKRAVPKERVRLDKDVVRDEHTVSEEVRKEQIDVDGDRV
jgi:uncharacterized protein (TIGR02271 family)